MSDDILKRFSQPQAPSGADAIAARFAPKPTVSNGPAPEGTDYNIPIGPGMPNIPVSLLKAAGKTALGFLESPGAMLESVTKPGANIPQAAQAATQYANEEGAGYSAPYRVAAQFASFAGVDVPHIEELARQGRTKEILTNVAPLAAATLLPAALRGEAPIKTEAPIAEPELPSGLGPKPYVTRRMLESMPPETAEEAAARRLKTAEINHAATVAKVEGETNHAPVEKPVAQPTIPTQPIETAAAEPGPLVKEALARRAAMEQPPTPAAPVEAAKSAPIATAPTSEPRIESPEFPQPVANMLQRANSHFEAQTNPKLTPEQREGNARAFARTADIAKNQFEEHAKQMSKAARTQLAGKLDAQTQDFTTRAEQLRTLARQTREHADTNRAIMERMATTGQYAKRLPVNVGGEQLAIEERPLPTETEKSVWRALQGVRTKEVPQAGAEAGIPAAGELLKQAKSALTEGAQEAIARGMSGDEARDFAFDYAHISDDELRQLEDIVGKQPTKAKYVGKAAKPEEISPLTVANVKLIKELYGLKSNPARIPTPDEMDMQAGRLERAAKQSAHFSRRLQARNAEEGRIGQPGIPVYKPKGEFNLSDAAIKEAQSRLLASGGGRYAPRPLTGKAVPTGWISPGEKYFVPAPDTHESALGRVSGLPNKQDQAAFAATHEGQNILKQALDEGYVRKQDFGNYQIGERTSANTQAIENDLMRDSAVGRMGRDNPIMIDSKLPNGQYYGYKIPWTEFEANDFNLEQTLNKYDERYRRGGVAANFGAGAPVPSEPVIKPEDAEARIQKNKELLDKLVDPGDITSIKDVNDVVDGLSDAMVKNPDLRMRGPIADEMTLQLASQLEMTPDDLINAKSHTAFNDAQVAFSNIVLNRDKATIRKVADNVRKGLNSRDEFMHALAHHIELEDAIRRKVGTEAGRALRARQLMKQDFEHTATQAGPEVSRTEMLGNAAFDILKKLPEDMKQQAVDAYLRLDQGNTRATSKFIRDYARFASNQNLLGRVNNAAFEIYLNSLLSGTPEIKKAASDSAMALLKPIVTIAGNLAHGEFDVRESMSQLHAMVAGAPAAVRAAAESWITELGAGSEFEPRQFAVPGTAGRIVRMPTRALAATNDFFDSLQGSMQLRGKATRDGIAQGMSGTKLADYVNKRVASPSIREWRDARDEARKQTFNEPLKGKTGALIKNLRGFPGGKWVIPIVKIPFNLFKMGLDFTPVGIARAFMHDKAFNDFMKGVNPRHVDMTDIKLRNNIFARNVVGVAAMAWAYNQARQNKLSGRGPSDPKVRQELEAAGWQPYSVKVGNHWISYRYLEPIATPLMMAGTIADTQRYDNMQTNHELIGRALTNVASGEMDLIPFMHSLAAVSAAVEGGAGGTSKLLRFADSEIGSLVPTGVADFAHAIDRTYRKTGTLKQEMESRIPGQTHKAPAYTDIFGNVSQRPANALGGFNPFPMTTEKQENMLLFRAEEAVRREEAKMRAITKKADEQLEKH